MRGLKLCCVVAVTCCAIVACTVVTDFDEGEIQTTKRETFLLQYNPQNLVEGYDVLFVVDNSADATQVVDGFVTSGGNMGPGVGGDVEDGTTLNFNSPILHVGIISPDLGTGDDPDGPCFGSGKDAALLTTTARDCPSLKEGTKFLTIEDHFTSDFEGGMEMGAALDCLIRGQTEQTDGGCPFIQPLKAVEEALPALESTGFLRSEAGLAIIFVSSKDDCSAASADLFDPENQHLGALNTYRCFRQGVVCDEDLTSPGQKTNCHANPDGTYVRTIDSFYDALTAYKDADKILVSTITAPLTPITVEEHLGAGLALSYSCGSLLEERGKPAVRLDQFQDMFEGDDLECSICDPDMGELLYKISDRMAAQTAVRCIPSVPVDTDPETPEMDADCKVWDVENLDTSEETRTGPYPPCNPENPEYPCYNVTFEEICNSDYHLDLMRDRPPKEETQVVAECLVKIE
jgi:hypothetical protein